VTKAGEWEINKEFDLEGTHEMLEKSSLVSFGKIYI